MNLEDYEKSGRAAYADLAETVAALLMAAIREQTGLRMQHVQHRAKDPSSLRAKLERASAEGSDSIETAAKDLAGCRVVLYTNSDVTRFLQSGIVRENFDVDWNRTKIHHPVPETNSAATPFISNNYVVKLKDDRIKLPEYARLAGMWCEVQVQTTLNHAWSETEHDILYKRGNSSGFGSLAMTAIEERLRGIMQKYLIPAGYEFQKVQNDFERLSSGKELFDRGALKALAECEDNNARAELLEKFLHYVLPNYDDVRNEHPEIRKTLKDVIRLAAATGLMPRSTPFGSMRGRTYDEVVALAADIFDHLRYIDVEGTFDDICEMYACSPTALSRQRWIKSAETLAKHDIDVWEDAGPVVQYRLVQDMDHLSDDNLLAICPLLVAAIAALLDTEISGAAMATYDSVTLRRGAVASSAMLSEARSRAIGILEKLLRLSSDEVERPTILRALFAATRWPHVGRLEPALLAGILNDARRVVDIFTATAPQLEYEVSQHIEHDLLWLHRHCTSLPPETAADPSVANAVGALREAILRFRDTVNANESYITYKTLVGFESVFPPAWETPDFDYEAEQRYREQRIEELVEGVSEANADRWFETLRRCAQTNSTDLATFPSFGEFLEKLARRKPQICLGYVERLEGPLARFLPAMLLGIDGGPLAGTLQTTLDRWVSEKRHLSHVIRFLRFAKQVDVNFLELALHTAIDADDDQAVLNAVGAAANRHADVADGLIDRVLMPAIAFLNSKGNSTWLEAIWLRPNQSVLFNDLRDQQVDVMLSGMLSRPEITHRDELVLAALAGRWPEKVIGLFDARLKAEQSRTWDPYSAIPFRLSKLGAPLSNVADSLLTQVKHWFDDDRTLFSYRGARLITAIFPNSSDRLNALLSELIAHGDVPSIEFVIAILQAYRGQPFLQMLCKQIVSVLPEQHPLLGSVEFILDSMGVVSGEFGMVTAFRQKKAAISLWLDDESPSIRGFAKQYTYSIDQQIAGEQRRSEEELALRKLDYGSPP